MKFLLDENLPPSFCRLFEEAGFEARHAYDVDLAHVEDEEIVSFAIQSGEIIVTYDLDFTRIVALSGGSKPSVVSLRFSVLSHSVLRVIIQNLREELRPSLESGALVAINELGIRVRELPLYR